MYNELKSLCQQNDSRKQVSDNAEVLWQNSDLFSGVLTMAKSCSVVSGEH